ncbi:MAG: F0F1 ATP synthase subunit epsilon [Chloroflexi bacterium]|nr:F0F1 ATP synthase subunit epsilon [Chloroflexota bacterium]
MAKLSVELVTPERLLVDEVNVDMVIAPGVAGQLAVLPNHAPLITELEPGVIVLRRDDADQLLAVSGGFFEVLRNKITVLADTSERSAEIDLERAQAARDRALQDLSAPLEPGDALRARIALLRAIARIRAAERAGR